jgi:hypothetical protein
MPVNFERLWDDNNFVVQAGILPGRPSFSGDELGPGIIYYPSDVDLGYRHAGITEPDALPRISSTGMDFLWNAGSGTEILNPRETSGRIVRVSLKPSPQLEKVLPERFFGLASAALLQDDWDALFKDSVRDDLEMIGAFVERLGFGRSETPGSFEDALLAKQDLDLKLLWSAGQYRLQGLFNRGPPLIGLAAATTATGLIDVTANTMDAAKTPVPACEVKYVKEIKKNDPAFYKSFSRFSTPTSQSLPVGNYEMWAEKSGQVATRRKIAVSGPSPQLVDLFAP